MMRFGRVDLPRLPPRGHLAEPVDMRLERVAMIRRNHDRRRDRTDRGNVARRLEHGTVARAIGVARIEHFHDNRMDLGRIVGWERESCSVTHVEPGEHPALFENAIPQPDEVFAIGRGHERRQVRFAEDAHFLGRPDGIAADREAAEPLRIALQCSDEDDASRMKAIGVHFPKPQRVEQRNVRGGEIVDARRSRQRVGLSEPRRIGRDAGEMCAPLRHEFAILGRGARTLVNQQQWRAFAAAAIMDSASADIDVVACDHGCNLSGQIHLDKCKSSLQGCAAREGGE